MKIQITGEIVDQSFGDGSFSPQDLKDALSGLDENEALEVEITSEGGSVFAGIQIANMLARWKGDVTTHAVGFVASIATVVLMAGKKVVADENCFCLVHNPWTMVQGNANDLKREIDTLEKCKEAMLGFYRRHAKVGDDVLSGYLDDETWFTGSELADVFDVEVLPNDKALDIAAKFDLTKYKKLPKGLAMDNESEEQINASETADGASEDEPKALTEPVNESDVGAEQEDVEELIERLKRENDELKSKLSECEKKLAECGKPKDGEDAPVTKAQVDQRISGIQSAMQKQINNLKGQLEAKEKELIKANADITSLTESLESTSKELSEMASAFEEKKAALDKLNASVNAQPEEIPTMKDGLAKCATPAERVAFLKSGKYTKN